MENRRTNQKEKRGPHPKRAGPLLNDEAKFSRFICAVGGKVMVAEPALEYSVSTGTKIDIKGGNTGVPHFALLPLRQRLDVALTSGLHLPRQECERMLERDASMSLRGEFGLSDTRLIVEAALEDVDSGFRGVASSFGIYEQNHDQFWQYLRRNSDDILEERVLRSTVQYCARRIGRFFGIGSRRFVSKLDLVLIRFSYQFGRKFKMLEVTPVWVGMPQCFIFSDSLSTWYCVARVISVVAILIVGSEKSHYLALYGENYIGDELSIEEEQKPLDTLSLEFGSGIARCFSALPVLPTLPHNLSDAESENEDDGVALCGLAEILPLDDHVLDLGLSAVDPTLVESGHNGFVRAFKDFEEVCLDLWIDVPHFWRLVWDEQAFSNACYWFAFVESLAEQSDLASVYQSCFVRTHKQCVQLLRPGMSWKKFRGLDLVYASLFERHCSKVTVDERRRLIGFLEKVTTLVVRQPDQQVEAKRRGLDFVYLHLAFGGRRMIDIDAMPRELGQKMRDARSRTNMIDAKGSLKAYPRDMVSASLLLLSLAKTIFKLAE